MLKLFSILITILLIILFPPAVLAFISNNAVPGDLTYPIKRKLEDGILALASINPTTKTYFQINRSDRRFNEAAVLIKRNISNAAALTDLTDQVSFTIDDLKKITDNAQKKQLAQQLSQSIIGYDQSLAQFQDVNPNISNQSNSKTSQLSESNQNLSSPSNSTPPPTQSIPPANIILSSAKPSPSSAQQNYPSPSVFRSPSPPLSNPPSTPPNDQRRQIDEARRKLEEQQRQLDEIKRLLAAQQNKPDSTEGNTQPSPSPDLGLEDDTNPPLDFNGLKDALSHINIDDLSSLVP